MRQVVNTSHVATATIVGRTRTSSNAKWIVWMLIPSMQVVSIGYKAWMSIPVKSDGSMETMGIDCNSR